MARTRRTKAAGPPTDRALQWKDMTPAARKGAEDVAADRGRNLPGLVRDRISTIQDKEAAGPVNHKMVQERVALQQVQPQIKSKVVTLGRAAKARTGLYKDALDRSEGGGPEGAGWYFQHHSDIRDAARKSGFETHTAINASAVMSPNNSPENEKKAVGALMDAHGPSNHTVSITPEAADAVARNSKGKVAVPAHQIGRVTSVHDLSPEVLAHLSGPEVRPHVQHSGIDLEGIAAGGTKTNVARAVNVLRGNDAGDIDPTTAPKIHTYRGNILAAVPGSAQHVEYMSRVIHHSDVMSGRQHEGQTMLDTHGLRDSAEGLLDHKGPTTEDTWQHAFTSRQELAPVGRASPAKTVSEFVSPGDSAVTHAYNQEATTRATASMNKEHGLGFNLPNVATQEVAWTRGRQMAGKDPAHNAEQNYVAPTSSADEANRAVRSVAKDKGVKLTAPVNPRQFKQEGLF